MYVYASKKVVLVMAAQGDAEILRGIMGRQHVSFFCVCVSVCVCKCVCVCVHG